MKAFGKSVGKQDSTNCLGTLFFPRQEVTPAALSLMGLMGRSGGQCLGGLSAPSCEGNDGLW